MVQPTAGVNFSVDEETRLILSSIDEFIEQEVRPIENELGETYTNPRKRHQDDGRLVPDVVDALQTVRKKSADAGFYAMNLPETVGGQDVSNVTWYRAYKHVSAKGPGLTEAVLAGPEGPKPLLVQAEGEQVERYLKPAIRAEKSTAFAQTEPGVGSDSPNMTTFATKEGDEWILNGTKQWITNAPYADFIQVFARTTSQEEAGRYGGISCFIVENREYELTSLNNTVGRVGYQGQISFDNVRIPANRILGTRDEAFYEAMAFLSLGRLEIGAQGVGHTDYLLDRAVEYANEREAFGNTIGKYQGVSHKIAKFRAQQYAVDAAGLRLAWEVDRGNDAIEQSSTVKYLSSNLLFDVADAVVGIHGGNGLSEDNPFMDELHTGRMLRIVEGTDEIQLNTIASQMGINT